MVPYILLVIIASRGEGVPRVQGCGAPWAKNERTSDQKTEKYVQKGIPKSMPKKECRKMTPKGSKIMQKLMPTYEIVHTFSKKAKTLQTFCCPIENVVLGM